MQIVPFLPAHLKRLRIQQAQAWCIADLDAETVEAHGTLPGYTALVADEPVACAGLLPQWQDRSIAWAYLATEAGPHMLGITRAVERFLTLRPERRIESYVDNGFAAAHRWMRVLGFEYEGLLRRFYQGRDMAIYARVK